VLYWDPRAEGAFDPEFDQMVRWNVDLLSGYSWWAPPKGGLREKVRAVLGYLGGSRCSVVVSFGWNTPITRLGLLWSIGVNRPSLLYGDSTWQFEPGGMWGTMRRLLLGVLCRLASGALATGAFNREFYIRHGMSPGAISSGVLPVDVQFFRQGRNAPPLTEAPPSAGSSFVVGFAGKFMEHKGPQELLSAAALLDRHTQWSIRLIGDGPQRAELERLVVELGIGDRVEFSGFVNQLEMPKLLASCDVVVVPSFKDNRGLIAVEAMAAGAAVVVSSNTGIWGPGDVVEQGMTGMVYQSGDPIALAVALERLMADPAEIVRLRDSADARLNRYGPEAFVTGLEEAVGQICR
jgi:glycosyltransferase involved in cell wall biosynthesis